MGTAGIRAMPIPGGRWPPSGGRSVRARDGGPRDWHSERLSCTTNAESAGEGPVLVGGARGQGLGTRKKESRESLPLASLSDPVPDPDP